MTCETVPAEAKEVQARPQPDGPPPEALRDVVVVLMAGGIGTRFWPLSTPDNPKQFLRELTDRSLYEQAVDRARQLVPDERILVMTNADFVELVRTQSPELPRENVICEPLRRDTAAAIVLAALMAEHRHPGCVTVVMPSDHFIGDMPAFRRTMASAVERARQGGLGTIGIRPSFPAESFGYLELAAKPGDLEAVPVERFVEKPDRETAEAYVASGRFLWNSGMFVWRARAVLGAAETHLPKTYRVLAKLAESFHDDAFPQRALDAFQRIEAISIDYGVMEHAEDVWVVPAIFQWSDVGGWLAAEALIPADAGGNRVRGSVTLDQTAGALVINKLDRPVVVAGLTDCIVVQCDSGTLVCHKGAADRIKPLIKDLLGGA